MRLLKLSALVLAALVTFYSGVSSAAAPEQKEVKMAVSAAFVSSSGMAIYEDLAAYLSRKSGLRVKVVSGFGSYDEIETLIGNGSVHMGFICGLPYVRAKAKGAYDLLAVPVMSLKQGGNEGSKGYEKIPGKYWSYTIVRKDSPITSWEQMRGKSYAFNDPGSNSGYNLPRAKLVDLGALSFEQYFTKVVRSGSHEESIRLVARGVVDASSVDSLVLDYERLLGKADALNVRIIDHLGPAGAPPVVYSRKADQAVAKTLQKILTTMQDDAEGAELLKKALLLRFDKGDDKNYDDIRANDKKAKDKGFKDHAG